MKGKRPDWIANVVTDVEGGRMDAPLVLPEVLVAPGGGLDAGFLLDPPQPASAIAAAIRISASRRVRNVLMFLLVVGALARTRVSPAQDPDTY